MNISLQNVDKVSAVLTVQIEKADYQEKVEKSLKTLRQRVNMPGFRKGWFYGLIKKQYGASVLVEEVDKLMQEKVGEYIRENNVNMLGTPLPKENNVNFEADETLNSHLILLWLLNSMLNCLTMILLITTISM